VQKIPNLEQIFSIHGCKDKRWKAGVIDGLRFAELITQDMWFHLRQKYSPVSKKTELHERHRIKRERGEV
jgi:hypothetical protein